MDRIDEVKSPLPTSLYCESAHMLLVLLVALCPGVLRTHRNAEAVREHPSYVMPSTWTCHRFGVWLTLATHHA